MSKLNNYSGSIDLISGLRQKNNGDFPLLTAHDVQVDESGKRLDTKLEEIAETAGTPGKDGTSVTITDISESTASGGSNVVTFSDGKTLTVKNGKDGKDYVLTDGDKTEIAENVKDVCIPKNQGVANVGKILVVGTDGNLTLADMPEGGASGDVIGTLDESNNILLSGNLADGTYTLKYENANGTYTEIGDLVVSSIADYAIITALENCTSSGATSVRINGSATVTITANNGYALPDSITVSGASYTWNKTTGNIVLSNPTSDVYISVAAEKGITNFIEYNADNTNDWSIWCNDARIGSDGKYRSSVDNNNVTNYIAVQNGDIVEWHDMPIHGAIIGLYTADKTVHVASAQLNIHVTNGHLTDATTLNATTYDGQFTIANASIAYVRFTIVREGYKNIFEDSDGIVNIKRNGEYL